MAGTLAVTGALWAIDDAARYASILAEASGLHRHRDVAERDVHELLDKLPRDRSATLLRSRLSRSGWPIEFGVMVDRGQVTGFKYTVDLMVGGSASSTIERVRQRIEPIAWRLGDASARDAIDTSVSAVIAGSSGDIAGVYVSVAHAHNGSTRARVHIVGTSGALDRSCLEQLGPGVLAPDHVDTVLAAAEGLGQHFVDVVSLGTSSRGTVGCKLYLKTNPYLDLSTLTRVISALRLRAGEAVSLLRWYDRFIGPHWGRLGAFGFGIDVTAGPKVEAYAYPADVREGDRSRMVPDGSSLGFLRPLLDDTGAVATRLYLAGCGTEVASLGRLGRLTIYLGVGAIA